jgi:STE24 endopeptidase
MRAFIYLTLALTFIVTAMASAPCVAQVPVSVPTAGTTDASPADSPITEFRLPPDKVEKATALYHTRIVLYVLGTIYGVFLPLLILGFRVSAKFRDIAARVSHRHFVQAIIFAPLLFVTMDVLTLPLELYSHHLAVGYGLSVQGWGSWSWDWIKAELVNTVIATLLIWGLYAILRKWPRRWWLFGWLAMIPVLLLLVFIQPVFIDPLFNTFDPLEAKQPQLVTALEKVIHRGGLEIPRSKMFEMRASDKVTTYNAYVTGIGASKRVVVWDNTARDMTIPETMFVFGHEQGHYVLNHIWKGLGLMIAGFLVVFYVAYRVIDILIARFGPRWGIAEQSDWASLPVLLLIVSVVSLVAQPILSAGSRYFEHQADIYGLEVIHDLVPDSSQVAAHAFQKLGEKGLSYPTPNALYAWWTYDHPAVGDRVRFAVQYRPWEQGTPTEFVK